jgi:alcohol dehydrogenase class IV
MTMNATTTSSSSFEFATANRIVFGAGKAAEIGTLAVSMGRCALVVIGGSAGALVRVESTLERLTAVGIDYATFSVTGEPTIQTIRDGLEQARRETCDCVIGFGGGSVLDTAKAIAAMMSNAGDPLDYLEVVGRGQAIAKPSAPCIAVPTTAGTGSEVTRNAVLGVPEHHVKVSMRSPLMLPRVAVVDPELTYDLPPELTASTGLDALTQVIEPLVSCRANPLTDGICREGIKRAARSLVAAVESGDPQSREDMAVASLCGGLALANAGLGAVHGLAGPLGGLIPAGHGAIVAALLPHVMAANVAALRRHGKSLERYDEVARLVTGSAKAGADDGVAWVSELCARLAIRPLGRLGFRESMIEDLVVKAERASSMKGNPVHLEVAELHQVVREALGAEHA